MSGALGLFAGAPVGIGLTQLGNSIQHALFSIPRAIGMIVPDVVIEEHHRDELVITRHPVEYGAAITDHAYAQPAELTMRCGFSNSSAPNPLSAFGFGSEDYAREMYRAIWTLQQSRMPFDVMTGKRIYHNMLIESLSVETTNRSEYSLFIDVRMREVIFVQLQTAQTNVTPIENQAIPQNTASPTETGSLSPQAVSQARIATLSQSTIAP